MGFKPNAPTDTEGRVITRDFEMRLMGKWAGWACETQKDCDTKTFMLAAELEGLLNERVEIHNLKILRGDEYFS